MRFHWEFSAALGLRIRRAALCLACLLAGCGNGAPPAGTGTPSKVETVAGEEGDIYEEELARLRREADRGTASTNDIKERTEKLAREMEAMTKEYEAMSRKNHDIEKELEKVREEIRDMEEKLGKK